jgi:Ca2+/H+ antiporter, TMEM165/GDT1 family
MTWHIGAAAVGAAFLASLVEAVEAFTIVLAAAAVRGWRVAALGAFAGLTVLVLLVLALGPLLERFPIAWLQLGIGAFLLIFGLRWLRKAMLRAAGIIPLHDEAAAFAAGSAELGRHESRLDWFAALASFKAVLLEGLEVALIVLAVGAPRGLLAAASLGAVAACALVALVGLALHRPLTRVPENQLKFAVGVMLSAFGVFWTGEGLGVAWPLGELAIVALAALFLGIALLAVVALKRPRFQP